MPESPQRKGKTVEEATRKVRFTANWMDSQTGVNAYNGDEKTMLAGVAGRAIATGAAVDVSPEALEAKSVEELKIEADALNVDLAGSKGSKKDIIGAIEKKGA